MFFSVSRVCPRTRRNTPSSFSPRASNMLIHTILSNLPHRQKQDGKSNQLRLAWALLAQGLEIG